MLIDRLESLKMSDESGPPREFEALFKENWSRIYQFLAHMLGDSDEAEDLALEAFIRLHARPGLLRGSQNPTGWLYRVAVNLGYNAMRSRKRRREYERKARAIEEEQADASDPATVAERSMESAQVRAVLASMQPRSARLLLLRHSGLSYREISAVTGVAPGSVGTLLARAEKDFEGRYRWRYGTPDFASSGNPEDGKIDEQTSASK